MGFKDYSAEASDNTHSSNLGSVQEECGLIVKPRASMQ